MVLLVTVAAAVSRSLLCFRGAELVMSAAHFFFSGGVRSSLLVAFVLCDCSIWRRRLRATVPIDDVSGASIFIIELILVSQERRQSAERLKGC